MEKIEQEQLCCEGRSAVDEIILRITVHFCEKLKSSILLTRPVVCMHVIDTSNSTYVKKSDRHRAVMSFYENQRDDVDYIMPVMTQPCVAEREKLRWEESFILNEKFEYFVEKNLDIILFFEIIDLIHLPSTKQYYERLNQNGMQKIAWAFLKVVGSNGIVNTGSKLRLQLYKPCTNRKNLKSRIEVYHWWMKFPRVPLQSSLYITVEPFSSFSTEPALRSVLPLQQEMGTSCTENLAGTLKDSASNLPELSKTVSDDNKDSEVIWSRKEGESCNIPTKLVLSLEIANNCQILKFSSSGRMIAAGCGTQGQYYLWIYEIPHGKLLHKELAHSEVIYDVDWSQNDCHLISASGDYNVKMWNVKSWALITSFVHPSYVYSAKFHPSYEDLIATACYDHVVRIWTFDKSAQLVKELEAHNNSVCAVCWFETENKLLSADSVGCIKVWKRSSLENFCVKGNYGSYSLEKEIRPLEIKGVSIIKITSGIHRNAICVFCSDSVARLVDLFSGKILCSYESSPISQRVTRGCCSPCGNLIFLCSTNGQVLVWNKNDSKRLSVLTNSLLSGHLSCVDYHPYDHMLAVSSWEEGIPINIFMFDGSDDQNMGQEIKAVEASEHQTSRDISLVESGPNSGGGKCNLLSKHLDVLSMNSMSSVHKTSEKYMYNTDRSIESSDAMPSEMYGAKESFSTSSTSSEVLRKFRKENYKSESLTAVLTKSGQFDIIGIADDFTESDNNDYKGCSSRNDIPAGLQRISKRSLRRKKLKELNKA